MADCMKLETYLRIRIATKCCKAPNIKTSTRNLPAHTNCNVDALPGSPIVWLLETYLRIRIATTERKRAPPFTASKLTCAYELQRRFYSLCNIRQGLETYLRIRIATSRRMSRGYNTNLETYLRIRIATITPKKIYDPSSLETYLRIRIATRSDCIAIAACVSRNLPAHTNCNLPERTR